MKTAVSSHHRLLRTRPIPPVVCAFLAVVVGALPTAARGQIFVACANTFADGEAIIAEYDTNTGFAINPSLVTNANVAFSMARVGSNLYTSNNNIGTASKYTTAGVEVNQNFIDVLSGPIGMTAVGNELFVFSDFTDAIGVFDATTGAVVDAERVSVSGTARHLAYADGYLYVPDYVSGVIGKYDATTGAAVNATLVSGLVNPTGIAVSGNDLYVVDEETGTLGHYDAATGTAINAQLITDLASPEDLALFDGELYVLNFGAGAIGKYATTGETIDANFVSNLPQFPLAFVIDASEPLVTNGELFVSNAGSFADGDITIGKYDLSGIPVDPTLVTDSNVAFGMALYGDSLFTSNNNLGTISQYTASGASVNPAFITGLQGPVGIAVDGDTLYVLTDQNQTIGTYNAVTGEAINASLATVSFGPRHLAVSEGFMYVTFGTDGNVGKYDAVTGAAVNATLITGLDHPTGIAASGGSVFVGNEGDGVVGKFDAVTGQEDFSFDVSGAGTIEDVQVLDGNLYVVDFGGTIRKYTTSGDVVNAALVTGLNLPLAIAIRNSCVPPAGDLNGDGRADGLDVASYVRCELGSPEPGDDCDAASGLTPMEFAELLLNSTETACP